MQGGAFGLDVKMVIFAVENKLAKTYENEKVVGKTSFDDCVHIATATVHRAELLVKTSNIL